MKNPPHLLASASLLLPFLFLPMVACSDGTPGPRPFGSGQTDTEDGGRKPGPDDGKEPGGSKGPPGKPGEGGGTPSWNFDWRDAIIYFPMVDRFLDGDGKNPCRVDDSRVADLANFKGGDWSGITKKIQEGYFQSLGVNTIWLSPTMENAIGPEEGVNENAGKWFTGYHAYWPRELDPQTPFHCFGTANDLHALVDTAHERGMKIIVDYPMVHMHKSSSIFASHPEYFWTRNGTEAWSICGGEKWEVFSRNAAGEWYWDPNREGNKCWFTPELAHWNYEIDEARALSTDNVVAWVNEYQFDGLRLDAIKHVDMRWLTDARKKVDAATLAAGKRDRFYLVGETYDGDPAKLKVHVNPKTMLDGQFDFALKYTVKDVMLARTRSMKDLADAVTTSETYYGPDVVMSTFLGNHDERRSILEAGGVGDPAAYERLANAFSVLLTVKGAPSILYGDEIGMPGDADPDNRRTMMFSGLTEEQEALRARIARLGAIRAGHASLRRGERTTLSTDGDVWFFRTSTPGDEVYVAINRGDSPQDVSGLPAGAWRELVTEAVLTDPRVTIPPRQTRVFSRK